MVKNVRSCFSGFYCYWLENFSILKFLRIILLLSSYHNGTLGEIIAEILWSQMRRMGLCEDEASHPVLGNIKQALELLVQQR